MADREAVLPVDLDDAAEGERHAEVGKLEALAASRRHYHYEPEFVDRLPPGFERVPAAEVVVNPATGMLVVFGAPLDTEEPPPDSDRWHSCDEMGCGSLGPHVLLVAQVTRPHDFRGEEALDE